MNRIGPVGLYALSRDADSIDSNVHAYSASAVSWALRGDLDQVHVEVGKLTDGQRDDLMRAASIVIAIAGGIDVDPAEEAHGRYVAALERKRT